MYSVIKVIHFCYGHRLLGYKGKCRYLHGHNGALEIEVRKPKLDRLGMVLDFAAIQKTVKRWVDTELDHTTILHKKDPLVPVLRAERQPLVLLGVNPTAEAIARHVYTQCRKRRIPVRSVRLWETPTSSALYRP